jgi:IS4 transposase
MNKNTFFTGQPIFSQIINLIPKAKVFQLSSRYETDRYYKKFKTYDHLITMLYSILNNCSSIREVVTGLLACENKLLHLGVNYSVKRSTLSEANAKRDVQVFEEIYKVLYSKYHKDLPDSRREKWYSKLFIFDSTTVSLFQEILRNAGRSPMNGKRKGGVKAHTLIKADEDVPKMVQFTSAAAHDTPFMQSVQLPSGSIVTFDKGYVDYKVFDKWQNENVSFVTRLRKSSIYEVERKCSVSEAQRKKGVISDHFIVLGHNHHKNITKINARLIKYHDKENNRDFEFLTNNFTLAAATIAEIYKRRWQIESLFKRIKQNYPLKYFLGDNENAIKIQIWCVLIADLLLKYIQKSVKRKWAFSNLASMVRLHLMNYINLGRFLENPEKAFIKVNRSRQIGLQLFPT